MAADFIGLILTDADQMIHDSGIRKGRYTVQRSRQRTLISSVGDFTFTHTLYKDQSGKTRCLLDELIHLPDMEEVPEEKRQCEYLYIEADEDHIHRQQGGKEQGCFIGKLIYLFEGKEEICKGKRKLVRPFYNRNFGQLYGEAASHGFF